MNLCTSEMFLITVFLTPSVSSVYICQWKSLTQRHFLKIWNLKKYFLIPVWPIHQLQRSAPSQQWQALYIPLWWPAPPQALSPPRGLPQKHHPPLILQQIHGSPQGLQEDLQGWSHQLYKRHARMYPFCLVKSCRLDANGT